MDLTGADVLRWLGVGLGWWLAAVSVCLPFRCRVRRWLRWLRPTLGLPLYLGALLEAWRSNGYPIRGGRSGQGAGGGRATGHPYRGFAPFAWGLGCALALGLIGGWLAGWIGSRLG